MQDVLFFFLLACLLAYFHDQQRTGVAILVQRQRQRGAVEVGERTILADDREGREGGLGIYEEGGGGGGGSD